MTQREVGLVKWFNDEKGCGFICRPGNLGDAFLNRSGFRDNPFVSLADGQTVEYQPTQGAQGIEAQDVIVLVD